MLPASFGTDLFVDESKNGGPTALLMTAKVAAVVKWPFPDVRAKRDAFIEALWIQPGFIRPVWGKTPPPVAVIPSSPSETPGAPKVKAAHADQAEDPMTHPVQSQEPENAQKAPDADGPGAVVADAAIDHVLDAMIPGAGFLHTILAAMESGSDGDGGPGMPEMTILNTRDRHAQAARDEAEAEKESEAEAENE